MHRAAAIAGERARLVPVREADLDLLARWFADPAFVRHWGGEPLDRREVAAKYIGRRPEVESFLVYERDEPVGYAQYRRRAGGGGIDMALLPEAQGAGLGPDAAVALVRHLLADLGWSYVSVDPAADNQRAIRAWIKAGFREVGRRDGAVIMERRAR